MFLTTAATAVYAATPLASMGSNRATEISIYVNRPVLPFIIRLKPEYRAIAAKVAGEFNTGCTDGRCELTDALELGEQCSPKHLALVQSAFGATAAAQCRYVPETGPQSARLRQFVLYPDASGVHAQIRYDRAIGAEVSCLIQKRDYVSGAGGAMSEKVLPSVSCTPNPVPVARTWWQRVLHRV